MKPDRRYRLIVAAASNGVTASCTIVAAVRVAVSRRSLSFLPLAQLSALWQYFSSRHIPASHRRNQLESHDTYDRLIALLDERHIPYRLIDHPPEGRTEIVSAIRGNALAEAAKCIVLMVKLGKKVTRHVLAVVPGDMRVDLAAVKALLGGTYVAFASSEVAERLAGSVTGTILPFTFTPELKLIADPALLENDTLYFNAARLDRSITLATRDYLAVAGPRLGRIAAGRSAPSNVVP